MLIIPINPDRLYTKNGKFWKDWNHILCLIVLAAGVGGKSFIIEFGWIWNFGCVSFVKWETGADFFSQQFTLNFLPDISEASVTPFITPILKSLVVPVIWLALTGAIYSRIAPFLALNRIFFPANKEATLKTKQPIRFQGLLKVTNQIAGKWKTKSIIWQILQLLFPKLLLSSPSKNGRINFKPGQHQ